MIGYYGLSVLTLIDELWLASSQLNSVTEIMYFPMWKSTLFQISHLQCEDSSKLVELHAVVNGCETLLAMTWVAAPSLK